MRQVNKHNYSGSYQDIPNQHQNYYSQEQKATPGFKQQNGGGSSYTGTIAKSRQKQSNLNSDDGFKLSAN